MKREMRMKKMVTQIHKILHELEPSEFNEMFLQATLANLALSFGYAFRFYNDAESKKEKRLTKKWKFKEADNGND